MRRRFLVSMCFAGALRASAAGSAAAQSAAPEAHPCDARSGATKAVCRAGYDAIAAITPVAALVVSGGNPHLGTAGGGKGFGDIAIGLRATVVRAVVPSTSYDGASDTVQAADRLPIIAPSLELRMGLFSKTLPVGIASVDFLGSVAGIPTGATDYVRFGADVRNIGGLALGFGYGLRIAMEPKKPMPLASLSFGRHDFPRFSVGDIAAGSDFAYSVSASAINVRLMVGQRFGGFEFTAGGGVDLIKGDYSVIYRDQDTDLPVPRADSTLSTMRIVTVTNGSFLLGKVARLTFEGGFQIGKNDDLVTIFEATNASSGRFFGSLGLAFKL